VRGIGRRSTNSDSRGISRARGSGGAVCGARTINSGRTPRGGWKYRRRHWRRRRRRRRRRQWWRRPWRDRRHRIHTLSLYPQKPDRTPILRAYSMRYYAQRHGYVCKGTTSSTYMYIDIHGILVPACGPLCISYWPSERAAHTYTRNSARSLHPLLWEPPRFVFT